MLYHLQRGGFLGRLSKVLGGFMSLCGSGGKYD